MQTEPSAVLPSSKESLMSYDSTPPCPAKNRCDVLVIGGGPAGSTAATLLAEMGHQVTLLEKAHHPRFHIGESLLPANMPLLDQLGVRGEVEAIGMQKWGAEFISPWHDHRQSFEFANAVEKIHANLYKGLLETMDDQDQDEYPYFVCPVCGHTAGQEAPETCPVCGAKGSLYKRVD